MNPFNIYKSMLSSLLRTRVWGFVLCLFLVSCAVVGGGPTGGKKDITPPKILGEEPENKSVNFTSQKIIIDFDEFIDLGSVSQEVIISPTLKKTPLIMANRKSLVVNFKGIDLAPNTTYSIQFGKAIKDYNEGNVLRNYRYVFSTGAYLDSLSVSGRAIDALSHNPGIAYRVQLYKPEDDSGIYKRKPLYYTRCDSFGRFKIDYLPKGDYQLYVLNTKANDNYVVTDNEDIGFPPGILHLDSNVQIKDSICVFPYVPTAVVIKRAQLANHMFQLKFDHAIDTFKLKAGGKDFNTSFKKMEDSRDSFTVWMSENFKNMEAVVFNKDFKLDTIVKADTEDVKPLKFTSKFVSSIDFSNYQNVPAVIIANKPIANIDLKRVKFYEGTTSLKGLTYRFLDSCHTTVGLFFNYEENRNYKFKFFPGSINSIFNETNAKRDTIVGTMTAPGLKNYGYFEMDVVPDASNYIFQLVNESGNVIFYKNVPRETLVKIPFVNPGKYHVRLIKDDNKNGKWDGGDMKTKREPEEVIYYPKLINMKANWEMTGLKFDLNPKPVKKP